ncbi:MAG: NAD(P)-dependent oxidoreductase [Peptoniphilaceae bacterium]|nr:NAD(P)-dependent oxidoreductase [Peptoniphilaceae bacterium]MDY6019294.1 NAD(P)-dependent oxidoreductase [Anaerococcus sp.]
MKFFPISINSQGKKIKIIGAGKAALIKTKTLLRGDFLIDIVSKNFLDEFYKLRDENQDRLRLIKEEVNENYDNFFCDFLIIATKDKNLNAYLRKKAKFLKIPTLDTADVLDSDFFLNKICKKNDLVFSLSTGGKAPSLAKYLAEDFCKYIEKKDYEKIDLLIKLRSELKKRGDKNIKELMKKAIVLDKSQIQRYIEGLHEDKNWNEIK